MGIPSMVSQDVQQAAFDPTDIRFLFDRYFERLVYFSMQIVKDKDIARDLTQDVFVNYWQNREAIHPNEIAAKNFLYTSLRNSSFNVVRHNRVVEEYMQQANDFEQEEGCAVDAIITSEVMAEIHSAIEALPEAYRLVSVMSYMEGMKNQKIADTLGMSINTVKKQKQRAIELLRLKLTPEIFVFLLMLIR